MTSDPDSARARQTPTGGNFALNAVLGAAVGALLSFVPFSPLLGGAVAGYLQGGDERVGAKVGAAAGVLAALPLVALLLAVGLFVPVGPDAGGAVAALLFVLVALLFGAVYVVGLSAAGGWAAARFARRRSDESAGRSPGATVQTERSHDRES